jgi:hypothetical protein
MLTVVELERQLNEALQHHRFMDAYESLYADDVAMQENTSAPTLGKATNRERQHAFYDSVAAFHECKLLGSAVAGDLAFSEWEFVFTLKSGVRFTLAEVAVRQWREGKVVHERFYWNQSTYPAAV